MLTEKENLVTSGREKVLDQVSLNISSLGASSNNVLVKLWPSFHFAVPVRLFKGVTKPGHVNEEVKTMPERPAQQDIALMLHTSRTAARPKAVSAVDSDPALQIDSLQS